MTSISRHAASVLARVTGLTIAAVVLAVAVMQASGSEVTSTDVSTGGRVTLTGGDGSAAVADADDVRLVAFDPWRGLQYSARKTANFVGCITGVGVPIGLAWSFATNPAMWSWVLGRGALPASAGGAAYNYATWVKARCAYAVR